MWPIWGGGWGIVFGLFILDRVILGDPGADSGGEGKSKRATKKIGKEKSIVRGILS